MTLRRRMAEFGFESNEDHQYAIDLLFAAPTPNLRCLAVCGESGRRKTAFANALAHALEYPHILYHDFTAPEPPPPPIVLSAEGEGQPQPEAPPTAFERVLIEACAFSEAARTVVILDQLQAAPFHDQIRLQHVVQHHEWTVGAATVRANPRHLLLVLIAESPLYHSLARVAFRIWTDAGAGRFDYRPEDVGLGAEAEALFVALEALFAQLAAVPTPGEFRRLIDDLLQRVRTEEQLRVSLYGWMERLDRALLFAPATAPLLADVVAAANALIGLEEVVLTTPADRP